MLGTANNSTRRNRQGELHAAVFDPTDFFCWLRNSRTSLSPLRRIHSTSIYTVSASWPLPPAPSHCLEVTLQTCAPMNEPQQQPPFTQCPGCHAFPQTPANIALASCLDPFLIPCATEIETPFTHSLSLSPETTRLLIHSKTDENSRPLTYCASFPPPTDHPSVCLMGPSLA